LEKGKAAKERLAPLLTAHTVFGVTKKYGSSVDDCPGYEAWPPCARHFLIMYLFTRTQDIQKNNSKMNNSQKSTQHKLTTTPTMRSGKRLQMNLDCVPIHHGTKQADDNGNSYKKVLPPPVAETVISNSQLLTSGIGTGEFGMNPACKGSAIAFLWLSKTTCFQD
jgi:hypothetical protein